MFLRFGNVHDGDGKFDCQVRSKVIWKLFGFLFSFQLAVGSEDS